MNKKYPVIFIKTNKITKLILEFFYFFSIHVVHIDTNLDAWLKKLIN